MHTIDLISTAEAAQILGVDRSTLSRWVASGRIVPAGRTSERGAMLFDRRDVEAFALRVSA